MNTFFVIQIEEQLFGLAKEWVAGVGVRNDSKVKPIEENGRKCLPLAHGHRAVICDFRDLLGIGDAASHGKQQFYVILSHHGRFMAVPMSGRGRLVMVNETTVHALPSAFQGQPRKLVPGIVHNGQDAIVLVDVQALMDIANAVACEDK
ncbi:chemotaxis protein CheW [Desulfobulbus propionicus]|uniref:chemotaxis protein CheW n=1 Tax=Desulfobulbus propionicus TaxID=894 RepID=UPI0005C1A2E9|nr:chemotaxis protein CheW [Desulfobulbus propionicus]